MKKIREYFMKDENVILALMNGRRALAKSHCERAQGCKWGSSLISSLVVGKSMESAVG